MTFDDAAGAGWAGKRINEDFQPASPKEKTLTSEFDDEVAPVGGVTRIPATVSQQSGRLP